MAIRLKITNFAHHLQPTTARPPPRDNRFLAIPHARPLTVLTLRCTAKVLKRLRVQPEPSPPPSTTRLGDWYANILYVERQQLIVCVSEVTRLPVILRVRSDEPLDARLAGAVGEILGALGLPHPIVREELAAMAEVKIAATASRSVLGSLNDYTYLLEGYWKANATLLDIALRIADAPCGPLKMEKPRNVTVELLSRPSRSMPYALPSERTGQQLRTTRRTSNCSCTLPTTSSSSRPTSI